MNALELGDGQNFRTQIGVRPLEPRFARTVQHATVTYRDGEGTDVYRLTYPDGSAIVVSGDAWDLAVEGSDDMDFCWAGNGHATSYATDTCQRGCTHVEG
jgi:hypothetical protein